MQIDKYENAVNLTRCVRACVCVCVLKCSAAFKKLEILLQSNNQITIFEWAEWKLKELVFEPSKGVKSIKELVPGKVFSVLCVKGDTLKKRNILKYFKTNIWSENEITSKVGIQIPDCLVSK